MSEGDPTRRADLDEWERRAEQAYTEMYEARRAKEPYEDASFAFARAIEAAQRLVPRFRSSHHFPARSFANSESKGTSNSMILVPL